MTDIRIDHSHAEADRRMRLLEMAGGDLDAAIMLEFWVRTGVRDPLQMAAISPVVHLPPIIPPPDSDLTIPPHLRRVPA